MRQSLLVMFSLPLLLLSVDANAREPQVTEVTEDVGFRVGVGATLHNFSSHGVVMVPLEWRRIRLEPYAAASYARADLTLPASEGSEEEESIRSVSTALTLGTGLHWLFHRQPTSVVYAGLDANASRLFWSTDVSSESLGSLGPSGPHWSVGAGPVLGAEYRPVDSLSVGLEVGVLGAATVGMASAGLGMPQAGTRGSLRLRYLF